MLEKLCTKSHRMKSVRQFYRWIGEDRVHKWDVHIRVRQGRRALRQRDQCSILQNMFYGVCCCIGFNTSTLLID